MNILSFLHFFAFLVYFYLLVFVLWKDPKSLLNRVFAVLLACFTLWNFGYIFVHNLNVSKDSAMLFVNIGSIGWGSFASFTLWFALIFTEKKKILKSKLFYPFIFILPLLFIYKQWTGFLIADHIKRPWGWVGVWSDSIWAHLYYLYYLSFITIVLYLVFNFKKKTKEIVQEKQAGIIFVTGVVSLILGTFNEVVLPELNIQTIPPLASVTTLIWAFGIVFAMAKYKLMVITPAVAAENIISTMAGSLILLDRQGNIASVNKAVLDLSGYGKDELTGRSIELFFREKDFKSTLLDKAVKREIIRNCEFSFKTKTGDNIPVIFSSSTMMDGAGGMAGIVCIVKDITERKQAEEELRLHAAIMDDVAEGICLIGLDDLLIKWTNEKFTRMFGYDPGEIVGKHVDIIDAPVERTFTETRTSIVKETGEWHGDVRNIKRDGTQFWCYANVSLFDHPEYGKVKVSVDTDITERKLAEEKTKLINIQLKERVKEFSCLFKFSELMEKPGISLEEIIQELVNFLPPAWQYPEITCARIIFGDKIFKTENFKETIWKQSGDIKIHKKIIGTIEVYYLEERPEIDKGPFLKEERDLLTIIAARLGSFIDRKNSKEQLQQSYQKTKIAMDATIATMSKIIEAKDPYTAGH